MEGMTARVEETVCAETIGDRVASSVMPSPPIAPGQPANIAGQNVGAMRHDRRGQRSPLGLGPLETAITQALWVADDWLVIREIRERMDYPPVACTTIATVTQILCRKGLLRRQTRRPGGTTRPARLALPRRPVGQRAHRATDRHAA